MIFTDTIVALSSGRLPSGVAIIRLSGPQTRFALETISGSVPTVRRVAYRQFRDSSGTLLDRGLVLYFQGPDSFTGEDVAEFHTHGGRAVVAAILQALTSLAGIRHAEPGEFTRRAFLNGKLSLPETEGLADLVNAETEAQRRFALANAEGAQTALYLDWRRRLIHARAMIEAEIDFSEEEDVPGSVAGVVWTDIEAMIGEIGRHIDGFRAAEIIRDGFDVVIVGAPNAGKSTLFNALARREAAIVSDEPGTTRDLLDVALDINGLKIRITDTAGLRDDAGKIEAMGIERARARVAEADLVLILEDMQMPVPVGLAADTPSMLRVGTKLDLVDSPRGAAYDIELSVKTAQGLDALIDRIGLLAKAKVAESGDILPSRLRHVELLKRTRSHLAVGWGAAGKGEELRAEELRSAADQLGRIVGSVDVEDLLDVIFSQFCIGK